MWYIYWKRSCYCNLMDFVCKKYFSNLDDCRGCHNTTLVTIVSFGKHIFLISSQTKKDSRFTPGNVFALKYLAFCFAFILSTIILKPGSQSKSKGLSIDYPHGSDHNSRQQSVSPSMPSVWYGSTGEKIQCWQKFPF